MVKRNLKIVFPGITLIIGLFFSQIVYASLMVFPTRLLLSDRKRSAQVSLRNTSTKPEKYRISVVFYRQSPSGSMELVPTPIPSDNSAIEAIRYSPREVELQPNVEQVVRVMILSPKKYADGDYYAHLFFEPSDAALDVLKDNKDRKSTDEKIAMQLNARMAVAIPVCYRTGNSSLTVELKNLQIHKTEKSVDYSVEVTKTGNRIVYGDFKAEFKPKDGGKPIELGNVLGVSSYVPSRMARYPLTLPNGFRMENGTLTLKLTESAEEGKGVLAQTELAIP